MDWEINLEECEVDFPDPKDKMFYEVATEKLKNAETWLVTGNTRHFPKEGFVITSRQMINILEEMNGDEK